MEDIGKQNYLLEELNDSDSAQVSGGYKNSNGDIRCDVCSG